ncbi:peroxisomal membrane protein PEX14-like isoform X1 [Eriocheir sinensis]|uniref:peroxisomal membrane protein PEX14-like isoform X1 n=1 Tax=Eriocheir sinensis TaxID=95602 RepID=UPI0021C670C6|nr:peroxisomal membrane protein PEX14-like isoform X1 [Eriocheir sinensis]XP_050687599.1 peroxisomal membrane protein PEX14-like isoform X1 [Eriocheir sinensis]XP_050687600.1 peroxisomal membrane protein PEX14-like isoform X1 [Eriocheir sinensis]
MSGNPPEEPQGFRQNLVDEAAKFLINPKVASHAEDKKLAFLKKKGLSDEEISSAFAKAKAYGPIDKVSNVATGPDFYPGAVVPAYPMPGPPSLWVKVRDIANIILLLTGAAYGLHYIFQRYIGPWLTGRRQKTVEESMVEMQQSVVSVLKEVQTTLASLEQTLSAQNIHIQALNNREGSHTSTKQLEQLRTEVSSLKGLLINKRTFPSTPSLAPSIPSWQRNKASEKPVEPAAESGVTLPNQVQATGEGDSWTSPDTQEAASNEAQGVIGEAAETLGLKNGELNEDAVERKESENSVEAHVEPSRP